MDHAALRALPLLLAFGLVLSCCSGPEEKAAAPFVDALGALGLGKVTYERAEQDAASIRLLKVRGTLDGRPMEADEVRGEGFASKEGGWSAGRIVALRMEGAVSAVELSVLASKGTSASGGAATYGRIGGVGVKARMMGIPVTAARLDFAVDDGGRTVEIEGLRIDDGLVADAAPLNFAKGVEWQLKAAVRSAPHEGLLVDIPDLRSPRGSVVGRMVLGGLGPDVPARLPSMDLKTLFDPGSWPEGVSIREASASVALRGPFPANLSVPAQDRYADPYIAGIAAAFGRMLSTGNVGGGFSAMPRVEIAVRKLGTLLAGKEAATELGLTTRIEGIPPAPKMAGPPPVR